MKMEFDNKKTTLREMTEAIKKASDTAIISVKKDKTIAYLNEFPGNKPRVAVSKRD